MRKNLLVLLFLFSFFSVGHAQFGSGPFGSGSGGGGSSFDPADHGDTTWGDGNTFDWTFDSGVTDPVFAFTSGAVDLDNASLTIHGTTSQVKFSNNMYINGDTSRKIKIGSTGGSNNEDLLIDNDTTANVISVTTDTGVTKIDLSTIGLLNTSTLNSFTNLSIGTAGAPGSGISVASNVSVGTAYAVAHAAPTNGLIVQGNVGIATWLPAFALDVQGTVRATNFTTQSSSAGEADFYETTANGTDYIGFKAPNSVSTTKTFTWPGADGSSGQALTTNGSGVLSFGSVSATPSGGQNAVQYASSGGFAGDETKLSFNGTNVGINTTNATTASLVLVKSSTTKLFNASSAAGGNGDYVTITNDGNVGIGSTAPQTRLTVVAPGTDGTTNAFIIRDSAFAQKVTVNSAGNIGIGSAFPASAVAVVGAITGQGITITPTSSSASALTITGTSTLTGKGMSIAEDNMTSGVGLSITSVATGMTGTLLSAQLTGSNVANTGAVLDVRNTGGNNTGPVFRAADSSSDTTPFLISSIGGNVGIGTDLPQAQLDLRYQSPTPPLFIGSSASDTTGAFLKMDGNGNVGLNSVSPGQILDVQGTIRQLSQKSCSTGLTTDSSGSINGCVASDMRLKTSIQNEVYDRNIIPALNPVLYSWKDGRDNQMHSGFIAQEVEKILPTAVVNAGPEYKGVDPNAVLAALVKEVQAHRRAIDNQKIVNVVIFAILLISILIRIVK